MLAESVIRIGRPIMQSDLSLEERIRLLTDASSISCKNYFQNVIVAELGKDTDTVHYLTIGMFDGDQKSFQVDARRNVSFPITFPNGGNPLVPQGVYALPCYLMWEPHLKKMIDAEAFAQEILLPRLNSTIGYRELMQAEREELALRISNLLAKNTQRFLREEKQLGILLVFDSRLAVYKIKEQLASEPSDLWIADSLCIPDSALYLDGEEFLNQFITAKMDEAASLGKAQNAVSTFSNQVSTEVVSIYNKSWLWLSPTWEMPCSNDWGKTDWIKGIKVDAENYAAFLYGSQFLKEIQVPLSNSLLKEMFAPIMSVEAKKHMKATSFQPIYGIPLVVPLLDGDSKQNFKKYRHMLKNQQHLSQTDLHMEVLAGMKGSIIPQFSDEHRLTILYYSGDLSRGDMHIRAIIEDIVPSIASKIQSILWRIKNYECGSIQDEFGVQRQPLYKTETLPSLLANAFGPGYVWNVLQKVFHRQSLEMKHLFQATEKKLNELVNKEDYWGMKQELIFFYVFILFYKLYNEQIRNVKGGVKDLADWKKIIEQYYSGELKDEDFNSLENLGFISGMLLKQFSHSYYMKTNKDFVKQRVMKFGSKLTPVMIWQQGVLRCQELADQWDLKLGVNFRGVLPLVLLGFLLANEKKTLVSEKNVFMTAFWSGYLLYRKPKNDNDSDSTEESIKGGSN